ncbi:lysoplasmalogenase family protein [Salinibacterium sp. PAMC 21357]|uniref:lysoplasmalogenase family protein n=1 Tax=Salinibacterium sp. PAMC 21357 TaxID=1112215 RepID=UPI000289EA90|nr:lysoplasmalogenase family protein [Salinibacterium sp. PAMC 21357]
MHILSLVLGADDVAHVTKLLLLMPLLMVVVVGSQRRSFGTAEIAVLAALSFAWIGDVFVSDASSSSFVIGLAAFLLCHVVYFTIFVRTVRTRRIPLAALLLVGWWGGTLFLLSDTSLAWALFAPTRTW